MEPAEAVLQFLAGIGSGSEVEFYLRLFRAGAPESFASIVFDPETWQKNADGVVLDLRLLATLSLSPVVVLGFYQPERASEFAAVLSAKLAAIEIASKVFDSSASRAEIAAAASRNEIPLLHLSELEENARELELARVLASLETRKLIFLRNRGGLQTGTHPLSVVNISDEYSELMSLPDLTLDQKHLLGSSQRLIAALDPRELLVTVTSPLSLLHELFTVRGAGTLLRRGARVERHTGYDGVDLEALRALLEASFDKPLNPAAFTRPVEHVYLEERYRGVAIVARTRLGSYLSKFAVTRQAQGEGIGRDLWQAMQEEERVLFWRARAKNPIRAWYEKQCDGRVRVREWMVYWIGLAPERIPEAIAHALSQPLDF
jgi:hypothetical protein